MVPPMHLNPKDLHEKYIVFFFAKLLVNIQTKVRTFQIDSQRIVTYTILGLGNVGQQHKRHVDGSNNKYRESVFTSFKGIGQY